VWFGVAERRRAHRGGGSLAGDLSATGAVVAIAVIGVGMLLQYATLSYVVGSEAPGSAKAMFELTLLTAPIVSVPLLVLIASVAWTERRTHGVTVRFAVSVIAVLVLIASPFSFASHGLFSPDVQQQIVFNTLILWLIVTDVLRPLD
jgi:hypothetical protein